MRAAFAFLAALAAWPVSIWMALTGEPSWEFLPLTVVACVGMWVAGASLGRGIR